MEHLYFDHGATTLLRREVKEAMIYSMDLFGNPSSLHDEGMRAKDEMEAARERVAGALGASPREILFTGSGTESNNLAILGVARRHRNRGNHIITTQVEHPSVLETCRFLEKEGFRITRLPVDDYGIIDPIELEKSLTPHTILVSVMAGNNEVGSLMPIPAIASLLREKGILFHTDAVQYFGKVPLDVANWGVDLLSIGGHKINGPKGVGALFVRKGVRLDPVFFGGGHERGLRPGTHNLSGIIGLGVAVQLAAKEAAETETRLTRLRGRLWDQISREIDGTHLNGHPVKRLPHNLNIRFERVEGQAVMLELNRVGIAVSSGSACSSGKGAPSHVLKAMGQSDEEAYQSLRITLGRETTEKDIDILTYRLQKILVALRSRIRS
ncbi:cysteine desulfurase family protein [Salinithrix halophila]|uniref:cysteine desulfurase n=1 Tax=Salinithrix halophila TaxID=1485204 RepID=A0ABV8JME5_9BACL